MNELSNDVMASFYRCRRADDFIETFYKSFLSKSPAIAQKFAATDFKLQKLLLRQSLLEMICFDRGLPGTHEEIARLGRSHQNMHITPEMYAWWLDALCEAIRQHDPDYSSALEQQWRYSMSKSINAMLSAGETNLTEEN